ncbi:hypothetical protein KJ359_000225 [Pestalotiopsis sp. 9143b]|nr:hypothetical protein KJ359_000225 [Pestalotiopsis sp. 9143b]
MTSIQNLLSPIDSNGSQPEDRKPPIAAAAATSETSHFTIEFILDTICPHCYIGLRNLNTAIDLYKRQHAGATFEVTCSPIILNPVAGRSVDLKGNYYQHTRHFAPSTIENWTRQGAEAGINFDWLGGWTGNSRDSHKLLRLALGAAPVTTHTPAATSQTQQQGARGPRTQMELAEAIYREYFENNRDVSDRAWLQEIGTSYVADAAPGEIRACLESEAWADAVDRLSDRNRAQFRAVPVFVIQGRFVAGGWQSPEKFLEVFERIRVAPPPAVSAAPVPPSNSNYHAVPRGMTQLSVPGGGWWESGVFRGAADPRQQGTGSPDCGRGAGGGNMG